MNFATRVKKDKEGAEEEEEEIEEGRKQVGKGMTDGMWTMKIQFFKIILDILIYCPKFNANFSILNLCI